MSIQLPCNSPSIQSFVMILTSLEKQNPTLQIHHQNIQIDELHPNLQSNNVCTVFSTEFVANFVTMSTASHNSHKRPYYATEW